MISVGQAVGNYRVSAKLGEGGMGAVFLAEHPVIGRKAALKVIHPQHARNPEVVQRFVNEATAINRIGHEHIVEVTDFGRTPDGEFYFIMEYLEGRSLAELIEREAPFEPARAVAVAVQIADALGASHDHGVIHRDVKPENIFLVAKGDDPAFVKVLDFGLAKLLDSPTPTQTQSGLVVGTPFYMAPEQCQSGRDIDHRADIYALGVVLFEMLTGKVPFGGRAYGEILIKQMNMRAPAVRSIVPSLPESLEAVLQRALAKDPAERFPTMAAFREALDDPANVGALPEAIVKDDHSSRMRAARPMSRAEIKHASAIALEAAPTLVSPAMSLHYDDLELDRVPRSRVGTVAAVAAVTACVGMVAVFGVTRGWPGRARAVAATASAPSAPHPVAVISRAPVVEALPAETGVAPSIPAIAPAGAAAIPEAGIDDDPPPSKQPASSRRSHARSAERRLERDPDLLMTTASERPLRDDEDADGVLAPSFLK